MEEVAQLRKALGVLDVKRQSMDQEASAIHSELTTPPTEGVEPMGVDTPLIDAEGYPRGDVDVYHARFLRRRFHELKTDRMENAKQIEDMLVQLAAAQNPDKAEEEKKEQQARVEPKPKPKFDPVTGKWVVMNWDGSVAGVPNGDQRNFQELERQVSGLTTDSDLLSAHSTSREEAAEPRPSIEQLVQQRPPFSRIDALVAGSPAAAAGLVEEDLICQFGPLHAENHNHLRAIAQLVPERAAEQRSIEIRLLRRPPHREGSPPRHEKKPDKWNVVTVELTPRPWNGRGLLGCHIVPYTA